MKKCLSVHQPWAYLLAVGRRKIEVRSWSTDYRGEVLIHAGMAVEQHEYKRLGLPDARGLKQRITQLTVGAIIGAATLTGVELVSKAQWEKLRRLHLERGERCYGDDTWCWFFKNAKLFRNPIPYAGMLGLFSVPASVVEPHQSQFTYAQVVIGKQNFYRPIHIR